MTKISTDPPAFRVRPAQPEEAGAFFAQTPEQNTQMGAIGCVRMDFGKSGTAFWHTWHPRGREELNTPEFKTELQQVVDKLRETVLKDLSSMRRFCHENGGKISGGWTQNYGYVVETERYEYCRAAIPCREIIKRTCHVLIWTSRRSTTPISRWSAGYISSTAMRSSSQMPKNIWTASARNCRMRRQLVSGFVQLRRTRRSARQWMISCLIFMVKKTRAMKKIII